MHSLIAVAQVPPRYVNALMRARYTIYSGLVNSDGYVDILARAKPIVIPIDLGDQLTPIVLFPSPTFVLMSDSSGNYTLDANPSATLRNNPNWQANTHDVVLGDIAGNGAGGMLIRSRTAGGTSFTIATSVANGAPQLLQKIAASDLGLDLGTAGTSAQLKDASRDGRADLIVRVNGIISAVFVADASGTYQRANDNPGSIIASWRALCAALDAGEVNSAVNFISVYAVPKYTTALNNLGPDITGLTQYWSDIQAVRVGTTFATYLLTQNFEGQERGHLITFVNESGRWVIEEL